MGRNATSVELQQQRDALNVAAAQGQSIVQTQAETMGRALFAAQVTDLNIPAQQFVTNLYEGFLQRGPDAGGLAFWTGQAGNTAQSRQNVLDAFATTGAFRELSGTLYRETFWLVSDHLGTPRMVVDRSGSLAGVKRHDYLPFGEEIGAGVGGRTTTQGYGASDNVRQKFTSKERDNETGLDYFEARYYSSIQGRFVSPDEFTGGPDELYDFVDDAADNPTFYAELTNPQSLNKYQYAYNNPLRYVDPNGHEPDDLLDQDQKEIQPQPPAPQCGYDCPLAVKEELYRQWLKEAHRIIEENKKIYKEREKRENDALVPPPPPSDLPCATQPCEPSTAPTAPQAPPSPEAARHKKRGTTSPSKLPKHQEGDARRQRDRGGEKGDANRRPPRRPPGGKTPKGGWPPKPPKPPKPPDPKKLLDPN